MIRRLEPGDRVRDGSGAEGIVERVDYAAALPTVVVAMDRGGVREGAEAMGYFEFVAGSGGRR